MNSKFDIVSYTHSKIQLITNKVLNNPATPLGTVISKTSNFNRLTNIDSGYYKCICVNNILEYIHIILKKGLSIRKFLLNTTIAECARKGTCSEIPKSSFLKKYLPFLYPTVAECGSSIVKKLSKSNLSKEHKDLIRKSPGLLPKKMVKELSKLSVHINPHLNYESSKRDGMIWAAHNLDLISTHYDTLNFNAVIRLEKVRLRKGGWHYTIPPLNTSLYDNDEFLTYYTSITVKKGLLDKNEFNINTVVPISIGPQNSSVCVQYPRSKVIEVSQSQATIPREAILWPLVNLGYYNNLINPDDLYGITHTKYIHDLYLSSNPYGNLHSVPILNFKDLVARQYLGSYIAYINLQKAVGLHHLGLNSKTPSDMKNRINDQRDLLLDELSRSIL